LRRAAIELSVGVMKFLTLLFAMVGLSGPSACGRIVASRATGRRSRRISRRHRSAFWAPWCSNCAAELAKNSWSTFIDTNAEVKFIFVTTWHSDNGREVLAKNGVGGQTNFELLLHPNPSRKAEDRMTQFLGLPVTWVPTTWIFRDGKLRYALNYGEVRFPILQQLIRDTTDKW